MEETKGPFSEEEREQSRKLLLRGWIIVLAIALAFVSYGLFAFFVIGDNQPAEWDFGAVKDTPGESVYSTYPYRSGTEEPEPQHVNQKPPDAAADPSDRVLSTPVARKPEPRKSLREPEPEQKVQHSGQVGTKK